MLMGVPSNKNVLHCLMFDIYCTIFHSELTDIKMDKRSKGGQSDDSLFRIAPYYYLHVLDQNTNVTRVEIGPKTYVRQDNEKVSFTLIK